MFQDFEHSILNQSKKFKSSFAFFYERDQRDECKRGQITQISEEGNRVKKLSQEERHVEEKNSKQKMNFFDSQCLQDEKIQDFFLKLVEEDEEFDNNRKKTLFCRNRQIQKQAIDSLNYIEIANQQTIPIKPVELDREKTVVLKKEKKDLYFIIKQAEILRLSQNYYLNDIIILNYLKIVDHFLPKKQSDNIYIYSTYLLSMLLDDFLKEKVQMSKEEMFKEIDKRVKKQYLKKIIKWTKGINIFTKHYLVFPINAFYHWNCIFVIFPEGILDPSSQKSTKILYLDSLQTKNQIFIYSIKKYLEIELQTKLEIKKSLYIQNIPTYQLLVPRQTNLCDCGLYMLTYIQCFLFNREKLKANFQIIENRNHLNLFPRSLILTMRFELKKLFNQLLGRFNTQEVIEEYFVRRQRIKESKEQQNYDTILEPQFGKYCAMLKKIEDFSEEKEYNMKVKFYLDLRINYIEREQ